MEGRGRQRDWADDTSEASSPATVPDVSPPAPVPALAPAPTPAPALAPAPEHLSTPASAWREACALLGQESWWHDILSTLGLCQ